MKKTFLSLSGILCCFVIFAVSCASAGNNFDDGKISQIKKGETTEADLVKMFGEPQNRSVSSENGLTLTWIYSEAKVKGESFIPYAGPFLGGTRAKSKTLSVMLADNKVTSFTYTGGGTETRNTTQDTPKN